MKHLLIFILLFCLVSCSFQEQHYYVESLDLNLSITKTGEDMYRIYLNKPGSTSDSNYIDFYYTLSEVPPEILLCFPINDSHAIDTIYVEDAYVFVTDYHSTDYNIILNTLVKPNQEFIPLLEWSDSTAFKTSCIIVNMHSHLDGIDVYKRVYDTTSPTQKHIIPIKSMSNSSIDSLDY